ncbi:hypothetical protein GBA52_000920 [Prunus armeniaca]|nr:hypothetical protein GBA52_000920 [Prunus armeniaca]
MSYISGGNLVKDAWTMAIKRSGVHLSKSTFLVAGLQRTKVNKSCGGCFAVNQSCVRTINYSQIQFTNSYHLLSSLTPLSMS